MIRRFCKKHLRLNRKPCDNREALLAELEASLYDDVTDEAVKPVSFLQPEHKAG